MDYLSIGRDQFPVPGDEYDGRLMCYVDVLFVMQPSMLSYTGGELTMGKESPMGAWGNPSWEKYNVCQREVDRNHYG